MQEVRKKARTQGIGGAMNLFLLIGAGVALLYGISAVYLYLGFRKKLSC